ncbi:patatin-like phospholipase family protein [Blastococcus sp. CT_GayMR19]|uniref:patatin-like phospholipase family protein n=1 Tax=Blastococcus sp. CT_GayMR19 TaxID=2559608 RepID=UPI001ADDDFAB|nr:patatin-like phospholipase family protein [Blastococcus sp. CT_GayMR19]
MTTPMPDLLVRDEPAERPRDRAGVALCLSGGGYRAMVFHAGVLAQLNELCYLPRLGFVSSVSGGSLAAGVLALAWRRLRFDPTGRAENFDELVLRPLREMAGRDVDRTCVITGLLTPRQTIADAVVDAYRAHLFGDATLQDLPDTPRFVFCATNLQTTSLVRFSKRHVADYRLGVARNVAVPLAVAVGASSAFPPFLSPARLRVPAEAWDREVPQALAEGVRDPLVLTDGGVYDNLGLEPVIKRSAQILVSNGGGYVGHPARIPGDWLRHLQRVTGVIDHQVRSLRQRMLVEGYRRGDYTGAYWSIRSAVAHYELPDPLPFPEARARELAGIPTRLARMDAADLDDLVRWGSVICDTAMRRWVLSGAGA